MKCEKHGEQATICRFCDAETIKRYTPIVTTPADDGSGRISAYDTTWPDVATKPHRRRT